MTYIQIQSYLSEYHPAIAKEVEERLRSQPCSTTVVEKIQKLTMSAISEPWQQRLVIITSTLLLCSPETIFTTCPVRKGVASTLAKCIGVSQQAVSKKVEQARHYYAHVATIRETVDNIVKEVRG
jgi:hypothetical protein